VLERRRSTAVGSMSDALAAQWGVVARRAGQTVWFELER
jgi:hypothetical protein